MATDTDPARSAEPAAAAAAIAAPEVQATPAKFDEPPKLADAPKLIPVVQSVGSEPTPSPTPDIVATIEGSSAGPAPTVQATAKVAAKPLKIDPLLKASPAPVSAKSGSRAVRFSLLAATLALTAGLGAAAGAAGFAGMMKFSQPVAVAPERSAASPQNAAEIKALKDSIAQVRGNIRSLNESITALRASVDGSGKSTQAQVTKLGDALERIERAQAEPAARMAKVAEAIERLEKRTVAATSPSAASPEITGSVRPQGSPPPLPPLHPDQRAQRGVVDGWTLREVYDGVALVQSRGGAYEVMVGDDIRGVGRVQDIRRQDGRWVVVTSRGLIVSAR